MMAGQGPESKPQKLVLPKPSMQQANGIHLSKDKYFFKALDFEQTQTV